MVNKLRREKESLKRDSDKMIRDLKLHYNRMKNLQEEIKLTIHSTTKRFLMWECFTFVMVGWLAVTTFRLFHNVFLAVFFPLTVFLFIWNTKVDRRNKLKAEREKYSHKIKVTPSVENIVEETVVSIIESGFFIHTGIEMKKLKDGIRKALTTSNQEFQDLKKREVYWKDKWEAQFKQQGESTKLRRDIESSLTKELKQKEEFIRRQDRIIALGDIECKLAVGVAKENKELKILVIKLKKLNAKKNKV